MLIRPAYPDEIARAKSLLADHPVPPHSTFLLGVKETPVERIVAAIPWWETPTSTPKALRFHLSSSSGLDDTQLLTIFRQLDQIAKERDATEIYLDIPLATAHPLYHLLLREGFEIAQTDRIFTSPGEIVKSRNLRIFNRAQPKRPKDWEFQSIRGQDPAKIFEIISAHGLMSPHQFQSYWNTGNKERFEEKYSSVLTCRGEILGLLLMTLRGETELHTHVEAVNPKFAHLSPLISVSIRNAAFQGCPEGFPAIFSFRADSHRHKQTGNSALRHGGTEHPPKHFLKRAVH
ncbi:hypothetical protein [Luteolibacter sp. AS25]|uniref:hypothetical protein n=1 Tax=Luteolibacter sp. AS25 TaxID=3135776 RepID=UPI00398A9994